MKRSYIFLAIAVMLTVTGCDFFRKLAGRPTSEDIESMRLELLRAEEAAVQSRIDSLRNAEQMMIRDSLNALDSIRQQGGSIRNPAALGGLFATKLEARYYIILGSFGVRANAEALFDKVKAAGYKPALISYGKGNLIAVGVSPVNKITDAHRELKKVKKEPFCPADAWILVNE